MPDPISIGLGAGAVLGLGGLVHDVAQSAWQRKQTESYNKWSRDFAERQHAAQLESQFYNQALSRKNLAMQEMQFDKNFNWQQYLARNSMQMRVEDLKRAGINPAVAAGVTPISSPNVGFSPVSGTSGVSGGSASGMSPPGSNFRENSGVIRDSILSLAARYLSNKAMLADVTAEAGVLSRQIQAVRDVTPKSVFYDIRFEGQKNGLPLPRHLRLPPY